MGGVVQARLRRWASEAKHEVQRWSYLDRATPTDTVLLTGSGRSGTTWVTEVLDRHHDHRIVFEPFAPRHVPEAAPFTPGLWLPPGTDDPAVADAARRILEGRLRNRWTDHHNRARVARRRLIKAIRVNNLLPWLAAAHPEVTIVHLVRHPGAVATSARGRGWRDHLDAMLDQPGLVDLHPPGTEAFLRGLTDPWERLVGQWCVENVIPLRHLGPDRVHLGVYEELVTDGGAAAAALVRHVGDRPDDELDRVLRRPSRLTDASGGQRSVPAIDGWTTRVGDERRARGAEIVDRCGLGAVWGVDAMPDVAALRALFARPVVSAGPGPRQAESGP